MPSELTSHINGMMDSLDDSVTHEQIYEQLRIGLNLSIKQDEIKKQEKQMSNLVEHAKRELKIAGLFDSDSDYSGMLGESILEIVEKFSEQGHSGASAGMSIHILSKLLAFENLTELTDNPEDWIEVGEGMWQNRRNSKCFSTDGGKTHYSLDDRSTMVDTKKYENPGN